MRFSWQPPQKRDSPERPLNQMSSLATGVPAAVPWLPLTCVAMPNLSISWMCSGTLAGTSAANEASLWSGISP